MFAYKRPEPVLISNPPLLSLNQSNINLRSNETSIDNTAFISTYIVVVDENHMRRSSIGRFPMLSYTKKAWFKLYSYDLNIRGNVKYKLVLFSFIEATIQLNLATV